MRWPMVCWLVFAAAATTNWADDKIEHFTLGLKYTINKHFAAHADYELHKSELVRRGVGLLPESLHRRTDLHLLKSHNRDTQPQEAPCTKIDNYSL